MISIYWIPVLMGFGSLIGAVVMGWLMSSKVEADHRQSRVYKESYEEMSGRYMTASNLYWELRQKVTQNPDYKIPMLQTIAFMPPTDAENLANITESGPQ